MTFIEGRNGRTPTTPKYAIAIHNTSNKGSARNEASYATRREDGIGTHFFADRIEVLQSVDTSKYVWHAGSSAGNHNAIAIEIVGTNDKSRQWWLDNVNWQQLGQTLATLTREYNIPVRRCTVAEMRANPKVKGFYSHNDMRQAWGGTSHDDPGPNFPWDVLFKHVNAYLHPTPVVEENDMTPEQAATLERIDQRLTTLFYGLDANNYPPKEVPYHGEPNQVKAQLDRIEQRLKALEDKEV